MERTNNGQIRRQSTWPERANRQLPTVTTRNPAPDPDHSGEEAERPARHRLEPARADRGRRFFLPQRLPKHQQPGGEQGRSEQADEDHFRHHQPAADPGEGNGEDEQRPDPSPIDMTRAGEPPTPHRDNQDVAGERDHRHRPIVGPREHQQCVVGRSAAKARRTVEQRSEEEEGGETGHGALRS